MEGLEDTNLLLLRVCVTSDRRLEVLGLFL